MREPVNPLNNQVWRLFRKAGFQTRPNESDGSEEVVTLSSGVRRTPDLVATDNDLDVTIVGENTTTANLPEAKSSYVHDLQSIMEAKHAQAGLFVWPNVDITSEEREYAKQRQILVWGRSELDYFESIVDTIGEYGKFEIIHSLGITTREEASTYKTLALKLKQPNQRSTTEVYQFTITPHNLLKTCVIYRRAQGDAQAYQRMLQKQRLPKLRRFVSSTDALLPTNIIVHLGDRVMFDPLVNQEVRDNQGREIRLTRPTDSEIGVLSIPLEYASLELIDGQHRLFGFAEADDDIRRNFNLVITGLVGLEETRKRDIFVSINDNSRRMDANLVAYLKYTNDDEQCERYPELMAIRIAVALNNRNSALYDRIKLLDMGLKPVTLKGISGYDLRTLVSPRGMLRRYYGPNFDGYIRALRMYFSVVQRLFREEWDNPERYILCTNRGISALLKLLKSILQTAGMQLAGC